MNRPMTSWQDDLWAALGRSQQDQQTALGSYDRQANDAAALGRIYANADYYAAYGNRMALQQRAIWQSAHGDSQLLSALAVQQRSLQGTPRPKSYRAERYTCGAKDMAVWLDGSSRIVIAYGVGGRATRREEFHAPGKVSAEEFVTIYLKFGPAVENAKAWDEYHYTCLPDAQADAGFPYRAPRSVSRFWQSLRSMIG